MTPLLEIQSLCLQLKRRSDRRPILRDVSLTVGDSEAVGLVGESGAGKSMLARTVMRLLPAAADMQGAARFDGQDIHRLTGAALDRYRRTGASLIPQDPRSAINPVHSISDFLTEPLVATAGLTKDEARRQAANALTDVAIEDPTRVLTQYPHELSGGMLQRVMICSALLSGSRLIVADEPTTALDATTQSDVMAILSELRRDRGLSLLFITHDLELAAAVCDRIAVMYAGEIVEIQDADALEQSPKHPYTAALFAARPRIESADSRLAAIPGRPAAAYEVDDASCSYLGRCAYARPDCQAARPTLEHDGEAWVRCVRAAELETALRPPEPIAPTPTAAVHQARVDDEREPGLTVTNLRKVFALRGARHHGGGGLVAVENVNFELPAGGSVAVVGESGSGKSTLVRMVAGLETPTAGSVVFSGRERPRPRTRSARRASARHVQMVFQNPYSSLDPRQSGDRSLDEMLRVHFDLGRPERRQRIAELGERVGLGPREMRALPRELSGGQRQRFAIARALVLQPSTLILDEAVAALDVSVQAQILNVLIDIRRELRLSYIFVSHDLAVVRHVSETVLVMQRGQIVEAGATADVLDHPRHPYTKLLRESLPRRGWVPIRRGLQPDAGGHAEQSTARSAGHGQEAR